MREPTPLHPDFAAAIRLLARTDVSHAEAHRLLIPIAVRLHAVRPSYWRVRRLLAAERRRRARRRKALDPILTDLLKGRMPRL